ncbi:NADP-dependent oxidoreductase domain-containing protein [Aspergillus ambiguus]|uniref:aldo/keto reductase n=1 Tax=Aspergillus ambiguus TaxID=176160 RepID=UPI003CCDE96A
MADLQVLVVDDPTATEFYDPGTPIFINSDNADLTETLSFWKRSLILFNKDSTSQDTLVATLKSAEVKAGKKIDVKFGQDQRSIENHFQDKRGNINSPISNPSRGGLILAINHSPHDRERIAKLSKNPRLQCYQFQAQESTTYLKDVDRELLAVTDRTARCLLRGLDVLFAVDESGRHAQATIRTFLRLLNPQPKYILTASREILEPVLEALQIEHAEILGPLSPGLVSWRSEEPTSKFAGTPLVLSPELDDTLLSALTTQKPPPQMQYQRLGKSALKVSKIILGCMTFGNPSWEGSPWVLPEEQALPLLKRAFDCGINTWDTANTYSNGQSEMIIGKALQTYSIPRSKVVIMTKLYYPVLDADDNRRPNPARNTGPLVNQMGLSRKHIFEAVDASLRRLQTTYIDVLQLHRLDPDAEPDEVMRALHDLVRIGKVHYIGASSMYCWQLARLQYTAKMNGWTPFTSMQGLYNLLYREDEREVNPFCRAEGIGLIPWSPLARGLLARPWNQETERSKKDVKTAKWFKGDANEDIVRRVQLLAERKGCSMTAVAVAWLLYKEACPIVGLNTMERIENISDALAVRLEDRELEFLEECYYPLAVQAI